MEEDDTVVVVDTLSVRCYRHRYIPITECDPSVWVAMQFFSRAGWVSLARSVVHNLRLAFLFSSIQHPIPLVPLT